MPEIRYYGTGKRKSAIARVYLRPGPGAFTVNRRKIEEFFPNEALKIIAKQPLLITETAEKFNVTAYTNGGGVTGQAEAVRLGIARALLEFNSELRKKLKDAGLLTRDSRIKERKKYGQPGARKRFQFSKR
ncbi:MAG TPA: 30S ribosomal protein S9 [Acidobacteriota bacterium]|nr:30S ribosomal protein S9 [Acidobacteriota bacterium]